MVKVRVSVPSALDTPLHSLTGVECSQSSTCSFGANPLAVTVTRPPGTDAPRRTYNEAFFKRILITRDESVEGVLAEPFASIITVSETANGASPEGEAPHANGSYKVTFQSDRCGGPKEIRTPDLLDANEARYQLRHRPMNRI